MKVIFKKEVYLVTYNYCSYCRINGEWGENSFGSILEWRQVGNETSLVLESAFLSMKREKSILEILN